MRKSDGLLKVGLESPERAIKTALPLRSAFRIHAPLLVLATWSPRAHARNRHNRRPEKRSSTLPFAINKHTKRSDPSD
jgi:hypothetical protein